MQNYNKFAFGLAVLATLSVASMAIQCYQCDGTIGQDGGCGQDPFHGHGVTTPDVTIIEATICYVSWSKCQ